MSRRLPKQPLSITQHLEVLRIITLDLELELYHLAVMEWNKFTLKWNGIDLR